MSLLWPAPDQAPKITSKSPPKAVELAAKLNASGAKMYGAFWCSHCQDQKETFGKDAIGSFPYVECFPDGWKRVSVVHSPEG